MSIEDQPTQQLRRPSEPTTPGPLNPTRPQPVAPVEPADDGSTDVLSLDNLFERQTTAAVPERATAPVATPVASTQPAGPPEPPPAPVERRVGERRVVDRRVGVVPVTASAPTRSQPGLGQRLRGDTTAAVHGGATRSRDWFTTGDNALIVATTLVALALILVIGLI